MTADERLRWHFIPNEMFPRKGVPLRAMTEAQRARAHDLLKSGLSQRGYLTASSIIELENVLRAIEKGGKFARDPVDYQFSVFGTPGAKDAWGWRVEGHHLSLHFTIAGGKAARMGVRARSLYSSVARSASISIANRFGAPAMGVTAWPIGCSKTPLVGCGSAGRSRT